MMIGNWLQFILIIALANSVMGRALAVESFPFEGEAPNYTQAQAERGKAFYDVSCGACHGLNLKGGQFGPPLLGAEFNSHWKEQPAQQLFSYIRSQMPPGGGGSLSVGAYEDVFAYMLQINGVQSGSTEFSVSDAPAPASGQNYRGSFLGQATENFDAYYKDEIKRRTALLETMRPVSDEILRTPPDSDWLMWRRTYSSLGYSPLKQLNTRNVHKLRMAWSHSLHASVNEITPLVHDGVLFVHSGDAVQAFGGVTGELLWEYVRELPEAENRGITSRTKGMAIYGNTLFVPIIDHMVALDAKTGKVVWEHEMLSEEVKSSGARLAGVPIVAKGNVIMGISLSISLKGGCWIVALDAQTGEEVWRFHTVARPGQPGGNSWNGLPVEQRFGGAIWTGGSYDSDLDLLYFGVGNTYNTSSLLLTETPPGHTNEGAYTAATVAINPDTGELVWYFQHMARDVWDMDWAFEELLVDMKIDGVMRKLVVTGGKMALFDAVDRTDGSYVFSRDVGLQNVVTAIDPRTGKKTYNPELEPAPKDTKLICPSAGGIRNWPSTAYNPQSHILYVPITNGCADFSWTPIGENDRKNGGIDQQFAARPRPRSDGLFGGVQAIDMRSGNTLWKNMRRAPNSSSVLATAGGLVFNGARDRYFRAYDQKNGEELWGARLDMVASASPISYGVDGEQYIAVVTGGGNPQDNHYVTLTPEIRNPTGAITLWVFKLPD